MVKNLIDIIFPNRCFSCDKILSTKNQILCVSCISKLPYHYEYQLSTNDFKNKIDDLTKIEHAFSLFYFYKKGIAQKLIHEMKYNNKPRIGEFLGENLAQQIKRNKAEPNFDAMLYIPTAKNTKRKRGYNQVEKFAQAISKNLDIPILHAVKLKNDYKKSQVGKSKTGRFQNLANAFEVMANENLNKKHLLIIDDVCTTGATLASFIQSIKQKYDAKFSVAVIAYRNND